MSGVPHTRGFRYDLEAFERDHASVKKLPSVPVFDTTIAPLSNTQAYAPKRN